MISIFGKKKLTDNKVANIFVNGLLESVEKGWPEVAGFIQDSPEFIKEPDIHHEDYGKFLMIVISANFLNIPKFFDDGHDKEIIRLVVNKFAHVFELESEQFARKVLDYKNFLSRVNQPSKNPVYAMSKAIFYKYELNDYQEDYFSSLKTPNPIFLKNLNEIMEHFIWDWSAFNEKFKVIEGEL